MLQRVWSKSGCVHDIVLKLASWLALHWIVCVCVCVRVANEYTNIQKSQPMGVNINGRQVYSNKHTTENLMLIKLFCSLNAAWYDQRRSHLKASVRFWRGRDQQLRDRRWQIYLAANVHLSAYWRALSQRWFMHAATSITSSRKVSPRYLRVPRSPARRKKAGFIFGKNLNASSPGGRI